MAKDVKLNPDQKVERFYPLAVIRNDFDEYGAFTVAYYNREWELRELMVSAIDELDAFLVAKHILKQKRPYLMDVPEPMQIAGGVLCFTSSCMLTGLGIVWLVS